jgi:hypothetical protein
MAPKRRPTMVWLTGCLKSLDVHFEASMASMRAECAILCYTGKTEMQEFVSERPRDQGVPCRSAIYTNIA